LKPPWKTWLVTAIRWSFLFDAIVLTLFSLLTAIKCPVWIPWTVGMVVPEIALWLSPLAVCFAIGAWVLRGKHGMLSLMTLILCVVAFSFLLKPTIQAWRLGHRLPAQLAAAFGPQTPAQVPFSFSAAVCPRAPAPLPIETYEYSKALLLDFYRAVGRTPAPCVVMVHGGSWVSGNRMDDGTKRWLNDWMARHRYAVASIDYRLSPQFIWPAQREDLLAAISFLKSDAAKLGIDPTRFVLIGRSAGGQMVTATSYWKHDPAIRGVVAIYPPTDFRMTWESATHPGNLDHRYNLELFLGGTPDTASAAYDSASGALFVDKQSPPTLILQGDLDINVFKAQSELLNEKLAAAGVPHALVSLPWAAHAFDFPNFDCPGSQIETYAVDWFLSSVTR
jgi:acetyl esterase/lipase